MECWNAILWDGKIVFGCNKAYIYFLSIVYTRNTQKRLRYTNVTLGYSAKTRYIVYINFIHLYISMDSILIHDIINLCPTFFTPYNSKYLIIISMFSYMIQCIYKILYSVMYNLYTFNMKLRLWGPATIPNLSEVLAAQW